MAMFTIQHPWLFTFGILGNIISFLVYLAPVPTFYRIIKKKSTEGFQSVPYVIALFSAMIWIYYASLKPNAVLLITINSAGCFIETIYIAIYLAYAPKKAMIFTLKLLVLLNFSGFWLILTLTHLLAKGSNRVEVLGWICLVLSVSVFAAPLSIMTQVVRTKSVEFMPFWLSFFLALSAVMWFFYGLLHKDFFVALPNILGFIFGVVQMVLYAVYKKSKNGTEDPKLEDSVVKPISSTVSTTDVHSVCSLQQQSCVENRETKDQNVDDQKPTEQCDELMDASNKV